MIPESYQSDDYTSFHFDIRRDGGNEAEVENWASLCGLDVYTSSNVGFVGLFVDDSGSMKKSQVIASYNKLVADLAAKGIEVREVVNSHENWIVPFLTTLVPQSNCITSAGDEGKCIDVSQCSTEGKTSVPWQEGDPEPNCRSYTTSIQCCISS